jgi:two-component system, NarL family, nitrate/nitrite response regulator NarL
LTAQVANTCSDSTDSTAGCIRIVLLDNHALFRAGLVYIIENQPDLKVEGQAGSPKEALELVTRKKPNIILYELNPLAGLGLEFIPALIRACPQTRVVLVTGVEDSEIYLQAVQNGVMGVVKKTQTPEVLLKAIRKVYSGEAWLDHTLISNLLANFSLGHPDGPADPETEKISQLTDRERQVIQLIGRGLKNQLIAKQLCIGETTVRHHLTSIYSKLGVSDRLELLVFAQHNGVLRDN